MHLSQVGRHGGEERQVGVVARVVRRRRILLRVVMMGWLLLLGLVGRELEMVLLLLLLLKLSTAVGAVRA